MRGSQNRRPGPARVLSLVLGMLAPGASVSAQAPSPLPSATEAALPIEVQADRMDYERDRGLVTATGNVVARRGGEEVKADRAVVDMNAQTIRATGNVVFTKPGTTWRGPELEYNFGTKEWASRHFDSTFEPFRVSAESSQVSRVEYRLYNARITTCALDPAESHYFVRAREVSVMPDDRLIARHAVLWMGGAPVFYVPWWYRSLSDRSVGWSLQPGYRSSMGYYLLTTCKYPLTPGWRAATELDYRTERGVAVGQEFHWGADDAGLAGGISAYYANDQGADEEAENTGVENLDADRYRLRFSHNQHLGERDYLLSDLQYLSDERMLEDFFEREYRERSQPDNFVSFTHRGDNYSAGALARMRLNDFYSQVNRLPEVSLAFQRQEIPGMLLYYEGQNSAASLEKVWEDGSDESDYSALRADSQHTVLYPTRQFGFLNFTPRVGYRGTYYSKTRETETVPATVDLATTNFTVANGATSAVVTVTSVATNVTRDVAAGAQLRSLFELGFETSFKAFRVWDTPGGTLDGLRHVVEPYANYTLIPGPTLKPENIYPFDGIDTLDQQHEIRIGARNKLQTRKDGRPSNLVDLDTYTTYRFHRDEGEDALSDVYFDAELRLVDWMAVNFDAALNLYEPNVDTFNLQTWLRETGPWRAYLEYRFQDGDSSLLSGDVTYAMNRDWSFNSITRYELDESQLEEQALRVQRMLDCMVIRLGLDYIAGYVQESGDTRDDEYRVMAEVWLTAFPNVRLGTSQRN